MGKQIAGTIDPLNICHHEGEATSYL